MDEKNLNQNEENTENNENAAVESVEETAEITAENTLEPEMTEDAVSDTSAEVSDNAEETPAEEPAETESDTETEFNGEVIQEPVINNEFTAEAIAEEQPKKNMGKVIGIVIAAVVVIAAIVLCIIFGPQWFNKYNRQGYIDVSGQTIEDIAKNIDMTVEEFLTEYDLPSDMPKNTNETAAFYTIPVSRMAEMYGMDFATMKETLQWGDEITETSTWGEAEGATKVGVYVGEENLDNFKEYYGLGDDVTADTLWKDIRNTIDQQRRDERIAMEAEQAQAEEEAQAEATQAPEADAQTADETAAEGEATQAPEK